MSGRPDQVHIIIQINLRRRLAALFRGGSLLSGQAGEEKFFGAVQIAVELLHFLVQGRESGVRHFLNQLAACFQDGTGDRKG